jgi:hypothetical protein
MAQIAEADITVGSSRIVGRLRINAGMIRSEAGPLEPRLVVPVTIEMNNRPTREMVAVTRLVAHLHLGNENDPGSEVGLPARAELIPGFYARSLPEGHGRHNADLRFQLTPIAVHRLEAARHAGSDQLFELKLRCEGEVAWIRQTWGETHSSQGRAGTIEPDDPFKLQLGLHSDLSLFWSVQIGTLRVQMEPSAWVSNVLPGLGIDTLRLIEVTFPPSLPGGSAAKAFDEAMRDFNARRYDECVSKCRTIIAAWNKKVGASKANPMAKAVASKLGWGTDDPRVKWLDGLWQSLTDLSNVPHHPENQRPSHQLGPYEARLQLLLTAALSEYLHALRV